MKRPDASLGSDVTCLVTMAVFVLGLVTLAVRLKAVQVDGAAAYRDAHDLQSVRRVATAGPRGRIVDRNGCVLADNARMLSLVCDVGSFPRATVSNVVAELKRLQATVGRPSPLDAADVRRHVVQTPAMPLVAWRRLDAGEVARFSERAADFPGFSVAEEDVRRYPGGRLASHLLGFVRPAREDTTSGDRGYAYRELEMRGREGLEFRYDGYLRGVPGESRFIVDARGYAKGVEVVEPAQRGLDLRLSLDARVQAEAERQLVGERGACAVVDPRTGAVLALASAPGFDPNQFSDALTESLLRRYDEDPAKPRLNRAVGGTYAPGSTFKPVTALAGLTLGVPADATYECTGLFEIGNFQLRCSARWGHGAVDMPEALKKSCNPYFSNLGCDVGTNALCAAARAFGLGKRTGLDFLLDAPGVVPDGAWKMRVYGEKWYPGDLAQMSIGQGMLLVTPLQMALVVGAIGTGYRVEPHLKADLAPVRKRLPFSEESLSVVRDGMRRVVRGGTRERRGTGWRGANGVNAWVIGKTGTAEIGRGATRRKNTWFVAYAESASRDEAGEFVRAASPGTCVAVAMVIENGESGGVTAAPRVANVLKRIFGEVREG